MLRGKFHDLIHNFVYVVGCATILFRMGIVVAMEPYYNYINDQWFANFTSLALVARTSKPRLDSSYIL